MTKKNQESKSKSTSYKKRRGTKRPSLSKRLNEQVKAGTHLSQNITLMKKYRIWKHGLSRTKSYSVWRGMMNRCYRKSDRAFKNYGGRGISVCNDWKDVNKFTNWFDKNYIKGYTLNRKDNNGNYSPENCNFVSSKDQARNKTNTKYSMEIADKVRKMSKDITTNQREIAKITGIDYRYVNLILKNKRWAI